MKVYELMALLSNCKANDDVAVYNEDDASGCPAHIYSGSTEEGGVSLTIRYFQGDIPTPMKDARWLNTSTPINDKEK